jgi:hypothetical protein
LNLARTAVRYKIEAAKIATVVRAELSVKKKNDRGKHNVSVKASSPEKERKGKL